MYVLDSLTITFHPSVQIPSTPLHLHRYRTCKPYLVGTSMIALMGWNVMLPPVAFVLVLECSAHVCGGVVSGASAIAAIYANIDAYIHLRCTPL